MEDEKYQRRAGIPIKSTNIKSKTARPFRVANMVLDYSIGIDDIAGNIDFLYDLRSPTGKLRGTKVEKTSCNGMKVLKISTHERKCVIMYMIMN